MTPDRDLVREALAAWDLYMLEPLRVPSVEHADALVAAARAWLEQGNAIIIQRDDLNEVRNYAGEVVAYQIDAADVLSVEDSP